MDVSATWMRKWDGLNCHRTQFGPSNLFRRLPEPTVKQMMSEEYFALAWPAPGGSVRGAFVMAIPGAAKEILATVSEWPGVEAHPHRFGGTEYRIGKREIGHIHGDSLVDIPIPDEGAG